MMHDDPTPMHLRRAPIYQPPHDYDDPYPGDFPRPRLSSWIPFACWLAVALVGGVILGVSIP